METLIKFKKTKIILADGGAFAGAFIMARSHDHANVKPNRLNIANRAVKQMRKIIFGILKSAFPYINYTGFILLCQSKTIEKTHNMW